jgi:hypothetical protein
VQEISPPVGTPNCNSETWLLRYKPWLFHFYPNFWTDNKEQTEKFSFEMTATSKPFTFYFARSGPTDIYEKTCRFSGGSGIGGSKGHDRLACTFWDCSVQLIAADGCDGRAGVFPRTLSLVPFFPAAFDTFSWELLSRVFICLNKATAGD